jgi:ankyrin repeat protein
MGNQDWAKEPNMPQGEGALKALDTHHDFLSTIRYLIKDAKADISAHEVTNSSPLLKAVQTRYAEAVELLLEAGASPNPIDTNTGQRRLLLVDAMKRSENHRVVKILLEAGAEVEPSQMPEGDLTRDESDELPIMHLTHPNSNPFYARHEYDVAQRICNRIKSIDKVVDSHTAMWHYIREGRQDIGILLMQEGASPGSANVYVYSGTLGFVATLEALD